MEQKTRGGRGFWYIWGSVLIKLGIAYLVYMAAVSLLAGVHLMQMTGGDADAMMQIARVQHSPANYMIRSQMS